MQELERMQRYIDRSGNENIRYGLKYDEMLALLRLADTEACKALYTAFAYGRAKGRRESGKKYLMNFYLKK